MIAKHTAGNWKAVGKCVLTDVSFGDFSKPVTIRKIADCENNPHYVSDEEAEANARFIAAAPDLLAVVQNLIDDRESCGIDESDPDDALAEIVRQARGSLAKALGELPSVPAPAEEGEE